MFSKRAAEMMAAVIFGDKIEKIIVGRVEGGFNGFFARIGDGAGRQTAI